MNQKPAPIPMRHTVFIVDDDDAVRDSLQWLLEAKGHRVQTFASSEEFLSHFDSKRTGCLILDVRMPGMSGLELQELLLAKNIVIPIIFITGHGDVPMAVTTMKKGAIDFIEKPFNEEAITALVDKMLIIATQQTEAHAHKEATDALLNRLTQREQQVLERIVAGRLNKQIADDLSISIKTVEAHRANIMEKLNVSTVADLLRLALQKDK
ncbi:response regulator transcription factor [Ampullimonas aquatilis]|uniref:response regulator transcription factor n=1 Tax=Ampullimonas aquatilis TaxID=1341549 RepID=UPI003C77F659